MSWHPTDSGERLGAMAKPSHTRRTPAKSSAPTKAEERSHPQLRAESKAEQARIRRNMKAIKSAQKRRDQRNPGAGNGVDSGTPPV
jgi:hypothetical protein